jgi:8-hydroxy-5-deazaflavin:NADPH oxidoreductase
MTSKKIGIIGAGSVGSAVGGALQRAGHDVVFGVREGSSTPGVPIAEAAKRDVIVLAVPGNAVADTAKALGDATGKVIVDATNSFGPGASGAVGLQALLPGAHVVKAFNTTGAENMGDAARLAHKPFMPVCGDHAESKQLVIHLANDVGFDAHDVGPLANAAGLEALARLWVTMARGGLGRDFAFAITRTR